jgi:glycine dehydrogenase subunit 1
MNYRYLPKTEQDRGTMLTTIGIKNEEELFADIPRELRAGKLDLPQAMSECELVQYFEQIAAKNTTLKGYSSFLGAGVYQHFIPSVVNHLASRSEFVTSYTPYQPEISQGALQALFEFQTMIAELTGMDAANSSMYDGGTALAEAAAMATAITKLNKIIISETVHPEARDILHTRAVGQGFEIVEISHKAGLTNLDELEQAIDENTAAVIVQYPNFFGLIEDLTAIGQLVHRSKGLFVVNANPLALGVLKSPGAYDADIVVGDCQPLGLAPNLGGPHAGFFATRKKDVRRMPGRIIGETTDQAGKVGYVLTLQAREQHIRREKATSNICSNQALMALTSAIYMSTMGKHGMREVATQNMQKADYAYQLLKAIPGVEIVNEGAFFNEFMIRLPRPAADVNRELLQDKIIGGYELGHNYVGMENVLLIAVTEMKSRSEIEHLAERLEAIL